MSNSKLEKVQDRKYPKVWVREGHWLICANHKGNYAPKKLQLVEKTSTSYSGEIIKQENGIKIIFENNI